MTTEVIFVELKLYETNLTKLVTTYEIAHQNYLDSISQKNIDASKIYLNQMNDLNQEIMLLMGEISQNITKLNNDDKYTKYKSEIAQKTTDLNALYQKMQVDEQTIKGLMHDLIDLDGKNQTYQLQHAMNRSHITFYLILLWVIIYVFIRLSAAIITGGTEPIPYETTILFLAIGVLVVLYWNNVAEWTSSVKIKAGSVTTSVYNNLLN
jgi:hypothetical protein